MYFKSIGQSILYVGLVFAIYLGTSKLAGYETSLEAFTFTLAMCSVFLHFMDKEDEKKK